MFGQDRKPMLFEVSKRIFDSKVEALSSFQKVCAQKVADLQLDARRSQCKLLEKNILACAFGLAFSTVVSLFFTPSMLMIQSRLEVRKVAGRPSSRRKLENQAAKARAQGAVDGVVAS